MGAVGDVLQADFFFSQGANTAMIVQFFKVTAGTTLSTLELDAAYSLSQHMGDVLVPLWLHGSAQFDRVRVKNVTDELGFAEDNTMFAGAIGGDAMPRYDAISIRQSVPTLLTRGGFKRLPYGSESQQSGGNWTAAELSQETILGFFQDEFNLNSHVDPHDLTDIILHPVIVGRTLNEEVPPVYELDLSKVQLVVAATARGWTTQNTRKR